MWDSLSLSTIWPKHGSHDTTQRRGGVTQETTFTKTTGNIRERQEGNIFETFNKWSFPLKIIQDSKKNY